MGLRVLYLSSHQLENILAPTWHDWMEENKNVTLPVYFIDCEFERQVELSAPSPVIRVTGCELNLLLQILLLFPDPSWPAVIAYLFHYLHYDAKKIIFETQLHNHKSEHKSISTPHPPGSIESLILAGVVCKWKGGHHPQHAPSLDPCQPHTSALICSSF